MLLIGQVLNICGPGVDALLLNSNLSSCLWWMSTFSKIISATNELA